MERLYLILGTSHVQPDVEDRLRRIIARALPDVIAVELDRARLDALRSAEKQSAVSTLRLGVFPFIFTLLGRMAQHLAGRWTGMEAGSDMLTAVRLAEETQARLLLADRPIMITLSQLKLIPLGEKFRLLGDMLFPWRVPKAYRQSLPGLVRSPDALSVKRIVNLMRERYPVLTRVLLDERNAWMAQRIMTTPGRVFLIVTGAAHAPGLAERLREDARGRVMIV